jgi:hypothetical protein
MTEKSGDGNSRKPFWAGLILGAFIGAALLLLVGWVLWDPPF